MFKFLLAPLAAALIFVTIAPAGAAVWVAPKPTPSTPGAGPSGETTSPGDPFYPEGSRRTSPGSRSSGGPTDLSSVPQDGNPTGNPNGPGVDPVTTGATGANTATNGVENSCGSDLGQLRRVRATDVRAVGFGDNVDVVPLCKDRMLGSMQRDVEGLRAPISQNATLMGALRADGYSSDHVVGVVVNDSLVVLYVH